MSKQSTSQDNTETELNEEEDTPKKWKSNVWNHFRFKKIEEQIDKSKIVCTICKKELTYHRTTTNMKNHFKLHSVILDNLTP